MARPSNKEARTEEILKAYEKCIARYGVDGATQQKISEVARIARPLLRHHVGNNDSLLESALKRFIIRSRKTNADMYADLIRQTSAQDFLIYLFSGDLDTECNDVMIAAAFIHAAQTHPNVSDAMSLWLDDFTRMIENSLQAIFPHVCREQVNVISAGVVGIYFNVWSLSSLGQNKKLEEDSFMAALALVKILEG